MKVTIHGSGDAFGSGGRFNTCFHLARQANGNVLIDCGASRTSGSRLLSVLMR